MTVETFFDKFDLFADAPDAVAKLRELVLGLSIRGKLSKDTGAWTDAPLGEVSKLRRGYDLPTQNRRHGSFPIFAANGPVGVHETHMVKGPGVVTGRSGSIGKVHFVKEDFWPLNTALYVEDFFGNDPKFICLLLRSLKLERFSTATAVPTLNRNVVHREIVRVPPIAEQKRIVAKVDDLMALCDRLEAQQQERETRHSLLARAALARFADAPTPANLDLLFHKSYSILPADLRKSILSLAVQGKLVAQDPNDEPADELIERLAREMSLENRCRQAAPLPPLATDSLQYELPESWTWARFRDVAIIASNLVKPDDFLDFAHLAPDNIEKGNGVLLPCSTVREDKVISSKHRFYPGQIVYSKIRPNLAKVVVVDFDGLCSADMYPIDALIDATYLHRYMLSESFLVQAVKTDTRVAMPKINQMELNAIAVPVPPLAEQRRIVTQVDELMALVDALETQLATARTTAKKLMEAVVAELTTQD